MDQKELTEMVQTIWQSLMRQTQKVMLARLKLIFAIFLRWNSCIVITLLLGGLPNSNDSRCFNRFLYIVYFIFVFIRGNTNLIDINFTQHVAINDFSLIKSINFIGFNTNQQGIGEYKLSKLEFIRGRFYWLLW